MPHIITSQLKLMKFRLTAFALHLLASALVLASVFGLLYFGWYAWPAWYLLGASTMVGLIVLVDVVLGPLLTLLIANPTKPRAELRRDIALIVLVQLVALGYGMFTLWQARPLFYALTLDRIELVSASDFEPSDLEQAAQKGATIMPAWTSRPQWIWAPLPSDPALAEKIVGEAIWGGKDVINMPELFRPWSEGTDTLRGVLHPLNMLAAKDGLSTEEYQTLLTRLSQPETEFGWLLLEGSKNNGTVIFERKSGKPIAFLRVTPKT